MKAILALEPLIVSAEKDAPLIARIQRESGLLLAAFFLRLCLLPQIREGNEEQSALSCSVSSAAFHVS